MQRQKIMGVLDNSKICCLDFSRFPALDDVMMNDCDIEDCLIFPFAKAAHCQLLSLDKASWARISVPKLIFLILASCTGRTPILEKMPCLMSGIC